MSGTFIAGLAFLGVGIYLVYKGYQDYDGMVKPATYKGFGGCFIAIGLIMIIVGGLKMTAKPTPAVIAPQPMIANPLYTKPVPMNVAKNIVVNPNGTAALPVAVKN